MVPASSSKADLKESLFNLRVNYPDSMPLEYKPKTSCCKDTWEAKQTLDTADLFLLTNLDELHIPSFGSVSLAVQFQYTDLFNNSISQHKP